MKYVAFDLEIAEDIPSGTDDWKSCRPLGITCAGLAKPNSATTAFWGVPRMTPEQNRNLADYLLSHYAEGHQIVTWNGLGFDIDVLAEECQSEEYTKALKELALNHIDIGFAMFCDKGYMVGLDTAAKGMNLAGKTEGMHGDLAPVMWKEGKIEKVLEYVKQDALTTAQVYEAILNKGRLHWISRSGRPNYWYINGTIKTVREALATPEPDTSWMSNPWSRSKFTGWLDG